MRHTFTIWVLLFGVASCSEDGLGKEDERTRASCLRFPEDELSREEIPPMQYEPEDVASFVEGTWSASCPATGLLGPCEIELTVELLDEPPLYMVARAEPEYEISQEERESCWGIDLPATQTFVTACDEAFSSTFERMFVYGTELATDSAPLEGGDAREPSGIPVVVGTKAADVPDGQANFRVALTPEHDLWFSSWDDASEQPAFVACEASFAPAG